MIKHTLLSLLLALLVSACGATPAGLATMTPVPRTSRPTLTPTATVTPTGTPVPSPTPRGQGGFHVVYPNGTETDCHDLLAAGGEAPWSDTVDTSGSSGTETIVMFCNLNDFSVTISLGLDAYAWGFSAATDASVVCWPVAIDCDLANPYVVTPGNVGGANPDCFNRQAVRAVDSRQFTVMPYREDTSNHNVYKVRLFSGDIGCSPTGYNNYAIAISAVPTPGPTPTPAPGCAITEVFARQGAACADYNLRGGCGTDDEFVELKCTPAQSLAGYQLGIAGLGAYTIKADNQTGPLKVFWADMWPQWSSTFTFPITGTARLTNTLGVSVDTRSFQTIPGLSWAATNWTDPDGAWWYYPPSPGH